MDLNEYTIILRLKQLAVFVGCILIFGFGYCAGTSASSADAVKTLSK